MNLTSKVASNSVAKNAVACNSAPGDSVAKWYIKAFPSDKEMGEEMKQNITFKQVLDAMKSGKDFYNYLRVDDSIVRERVFSEMARVFRFPYDAIYDLWLRGPKDADVVTRWGKKLGIAVKENPIVTEWKDMFMKWIVSSRKPDQTQKVKAFWEKNKGIIKKEWQDWRNFKGVEFLNSVANSADAFGNPIKVGDKVKFATGAFRGIEGKVKKIDNRGGKATATVTTQEYGDIEEPLAIIKVANAKMARTQYGTGHMTPDAIKRHVDRIIRLYGGVDAMKKVHRGRMFLDEFLEAQDRGQTTMDKESYDAMQREFRRRVLSNAAPVAANANGKFLASWETKSGTRPINPDEYPSEAEAIRSVKRSLRGNLMAGEKGYWRVWPKGEDPFELQWLGKLKEGEIRNSVANSCDLKSKVAQNAVGINGNIEVIIYPRWKKGVPPRRFDSVSKAREYVKREYDAEIDLPRSEEDDFATADIITTLTGNRVRIGLVQAL